VPQLLKALSAACNDTRAGAARALGVLRPQPDIVIPELCAMLGEKNSSVVAEAAQALGQFGTQAESAAPRLLARLTAALTDCDRQLIEVLAGTLLAITADPKRHVRDYFRQGDSELRQLALAALKEQRALSQGNLADGRQGDGHARRPE
jgi:HEAT repeat protein